MNCISPQYKWNSSWILGLFWLLPHFQVWPVLLYLWNVSKITPHFYIKSLHRMRSWDKIDMYAFYGQKNFQFCSFIREVTTVPESYSYPLTFFRWDIAPAALPLRVPSLYLLDHLLVLWALTNRSSISFSRSLFLILNNVCMGSFFPHFTSLQYFLLLTPVSLFNCHSSY